MMRLHFSAVSRKASWLLLLIFLALAIFLCSLGFVYYRGQEREISGHVKEELLAVSHLKLDQVVAWRKERLADAETIRDNFLLAPYIEGLLDDPGGARGKDEFLRWMGSFKAAFQYEDILLIDGRGNVLLSVSSQKSVAIGAGGRLVVSRAAKARDIVFSDLYREGTGRVCLDIAVPISYDKKGDVLGVILLRMDPYTFLFPLIETWPTTSPTAETMLVRREGKDVVFLNNVRHQKGSALSLRLPIGDGALPAAMALLGREGIVEGVDYRGTAVYAAVRRIPDSPWAIVSKVDKEEISGPVRQRLWAVLVLIGLAIFSSGVGVLMLWRVRENEEQKAYLRYLEETVKGRTADLERANSQLRESYEDLEGFSHSVSHDLRQPLIVIEGFARRLLKKCAGKLDDGEREYLSAIRDQAGKMTQFVGDLLIFSRASKKDVKRSDIDMNVLVQDVVADLEKTVDGRCVEFVVGDLEPAAGDPLMVRQALVNLMSNALKYSGTREAARIEVGNTVMEGANTYFVKDNGVGFDSGSKDKLFSLFNRLHSSREFEGTGIGLVITKKIVNKHGGRIWATGVVDGGATFYFTLPGNVRKP